MHSVELIYSRSCPNVDAARAALLSAFRLVGLTPQWTEWDSEDSDAPANAHRYGSPTVLVDGLDVAGVEPGTNSGSCRVYNGAQIGVPTPDMIAAVLSAPDQLQEVGGKRGWARTLAILPGAGLTLLPIGACPACWPAYAGLLSSLGMGFLLESKFLLPIMSSFLALALITLGFRAKSRHGYGPLMLGLLATIIALLGKFAFIFDPMLFVGMGLLVGASLWNTWPRKAVGNGSCGRCASQVQDNANLAHSPEESQ